MNNNGKILYSIYSIVIIYLLLFIAITYIRPGYDQDENLIIVGPDDFLFGNLLNQTISNYQTYFNATLVDDLPKSKVNTLIIFAHGNSANGSIYLELQNGLFNTADLHANRVIYIACSVGVIRNIDTNTEHFSYSKTIELDHVITSNQTINGKIVVESWSWNIYFLDYIKNGYDWYVAEELARNDFDVQYYYIFGEFPNGSILMEGSN